MTLTADLYHVPVDHEWTTYGRYLLMGSLLVGCLIWRLIKHWTFTRKYRFPNEIPGPPIIANSFQMPRRRQGPFTLELAKKHGEMSVFTKFRRLLGFTMHFGRTPWLFLNSRRVVNELLEKRAAIYSSRQNLAMANWLVSGGKRILVMPYGDLWRRQRKVMHKILNATQQKYFHPLQDLESRALLYHYALRPDLWWQANARFANSVILGVVFGIRSDLDDPDLAAVLKNTEQFVRFLIPGQAVVDLAPWLLKIPFLKAWQPWRWYSDKLYRSTVRVYKKLVDDLEERQRLGLQKPCFMTEFLDKGQDKEFQEEEVYFMAGTLIEAGSDTTRNTLIEMVAAAALYPDWVERARKQIDAVCGANAERLPSFGDMPQLPLVKAVAKETLRWKPMIAETGIPHALIKNDQFEGYSFPAGTVVTWNHWGISNLPTEYDDPDRFWPERFLDADLDLPAKGHLGFGAGRRVCVGSTVAWNNMFISMSRLLYCFVFELDPTEPIDVSESFYGGFDRAPFKVRIKSRSEAHRQLVERECRDAAIIK